MTRTALTWMSVALLVVGAGCSGGKTSTSQPVAPAPAPQTQGNMTFPTIRIGDDRPSPKTGPTTGSTTQPTGKAVTTISAVDLTKEYKNDAEAAQSTFGNHTLTVEGTVDDTNGKDPEGKPQLKLGGLENRHFVLCGLTPNSQAKVAQLTKGQKIKLTGRVIRGFGVAVIMDGCEIVETTPTAPQAAIPATQLTQDASKDAEAVNKKYGGKEVVVEGTIAKIDFKPGTGVRSVYLAGHNEKAEEPVRVQGEFQVDHEGALAKLKVGQKVKIKGEFRRAGEEKIFIGRVALVE